LLHQEEERKLSLKDTAASSSLLPPPPLEDFEPPTVLSKLTYLENAIQWSSAKFAEIDKFEQNIKQAQNAMIASEVKMRAL
jgi:hypothetical protein